MSWDTSIWRAAKTDRSLLAVPAGVRGRKGLASFPNTFGEKPQSASLTETSRNDHPTVKTTAGPGAILTT